jgi:hypothetical protein
MLRLERLERSSRLERLAVMQKKQVPETQSASLVWGQFDFHS